MSRNLKFLHMWINFTFHHMTDVEKSEISFIMCTLYSILLHFTLFCCKKFIFLRFTLFFAKSFFCDLRCFLQNRFVAIYCLEKILAKNSDRGEKIKNIRYAVACSCNPAICKGWFGRGHQPNTKSNLPEIYMRLKM